MSSLAAVRVTLVTLLAAAAWQQAWGTALPSSTSRQLAGAGGKFVTACCSLKAAHGWLWTAFKLHSVCGAVQTPLLRVHASTLQTQ